MAYNTGMAVEKRCSLNSEKGLGRQFETVFTMPSRASFDYCHSNKVIFFTRKSTLWYIYLYRLEYRLEYLHQVYNILQKLRPIAAFDKLSPCTLSTVHSYDESVSGNSARVYITNVAVLFLRVNFSLLYSILQSCHEIAFQCFSL